MVESSLGPRFVSTLSRLSVPRSRIKRDRYIEVGLSMAHCPSESGFSRHLKPAKRRLRKSATIHNHGGTLRWSWPSGNSSMTLWNCSRVTSGPKSATKVVLEPLPRRFPPMPEKPTGNSPPLHVGQRPQVLLHRPRPGGAGGRTTGQLRELRRRRPRSRTGTVSAAAGGLDFS